MPNRYESVLAKHEQEKSSLSTAARANRYEEILKNHLSSKSASVSDENSGVSGNGRAAPSSTSSLENSQVESIAERASRLQLDDDSSDDEAPTPLMKPFVRNSSGDQGQQPSNSKWEIEVERLQQISHTAKTTDPDESEEVSSLAAPRSTQEINSSVKHMRHRMRARAARRAAAK
eukprot:CAMPEP_0118941356 /NCGR_PEP_ID=MMETSP1169-20130426/33665_1 /TAXON_ID=36882 /ORGANISM="Pyramimonas obovata, Strain CCMP722" /LENGTH=174 /DNA_ID=CAMNT_0006886081 /DNA_START=141 /DNA_END=665 /DNA_ORIENTATION=-